jgi:hypothetical protein
MKQNQSEQPLKKAADLQVLSASVSRALLAAKLGAQYSGDRDIYKALGYATNPQYEDYTTQYVRQDIAKAIIDRPISKTWRGELRVLESDDENETQFEKAWITLDKELQLKSKFIRVDKLTCLGKYGVLLLGFNDVRNTEDFNKPVSGTKLKLLYVKPLGEGNIEIDKWVEDTSDPRYGLPLTYALAIKSQDNEKEQILRVNYTRVIHITQGLLENETEGTPVLESVYNRLKDLEKLVGGSAEMFWRGARPGYQGKLDPDYQTTDQTETQMKDQIDEYEHNLRRILLSEGYDLKALEQQLADPKNYVDIQIQMISAVTGIPKRILTGSERGELASTQDETSWYTEIQSRREEYAEICIVKPFIDKCIEYGVLPKPTEYDVVWPDLFTMGEKEQAEIGKIRASALKEYTSNPASEYIVPPDAFFEYFLGLGKEDIELIQQMAENNMDEEMRAQRNNPEPVPGSEEPLEDEEVQ